MTKSIFLTIRISEQEHKLIEQIAATSTCNNRSAIVRFAIYELGRQWGLLEVGSPLHALQAKCQSRIEQWQGGEQ